MGASLYSSQSDFIYIHNHIHLSKIYHLDTKKSPRKLFGELCQIYFSISKFQIIYAWQTSLNSRCEDVRNLYDKMSLHQHIKIHILKTPIGQQMFDRVHSVGLS